MEIQQKKAVRPADDFIRIQDLWSLFIPRWGWFVLSLALCLGVAALYLARTPNVYTRYAELLTLWGTRDVRDNKQLIAPLRSALILMAITLSG